LTILLWLGFIALILLLVSIELGRMQRHARVLGRYDALASTLLWIALPLAFNVAIYFLYENHWLGAGLTPGRELDGRTAALQFFTGYLIQKGLTLDNISVIALILSHFRVPLEYQCRVLVPSILGAILLRGAMIAGGVVLIHFFPRTSYVFGVLVIFTALRMLAHRSGPLKLDDGLAMRLVKRRYPPAAGFDGERFLTRADETWAGTPLLYALVMIISATAIFAVDSVPAIMAVTREPFIIFGSIIFAVLGLHSLYFLLASVLERLQYFRLALVGILIFVGVKMLLMHVAPISTGVALAVVSALLLAGALASLLLQPPPAGLVSPIAEELDQLIQLTLTSARRIVVLVMGTTVLLVGIAMIVTPGPSILVIPLGLAILGTEFVWAQRLLKRFQKEARHLSDTALEILRRRKKR
jgi:tellurite resistance protein TerC